MRYILNPGEYEEVQTFTDHTDADKEYQRLKSAKAFPKLYRVSLSRPGNVMAWDVWTEDHGFIPVNRDNLPVKVLDAVS